MFFFFFFFLLRIYDATYHFLTLGLNHHYHLDYVSSAKKMNRESYVWTLTLERTEIRKRVFQSEKQNCTCIRSRIFFSFSLQGTWQSMSLATWLDVSYLKLVENRKNRIFRSYYKDPWIRLNKAFVILLIRCSESRKRKQRNQGSYAKVSWKEDNGFIVRKNIF